MTIEIAVRLRGDHVDQLDELVAASQAPRRAFVIERALTREFRRLSGAKDAAILAEAGRDEDMDSLADYQRTTAIHAALDLD